MIHKPFSYLTRLKAAMGNGEATDGLFFPLEIQELFLEKFKQPEHGGMVWKSTKYGISIDGLLEERWYTFTMSAIMNLTNGMGIKQSYDYLVILHDTSEAE